MTPSPLSALLIAHTPKLQKELRQQPRLKNSYVITLSLEATSFSIFETPSFVRAQPRLFWFPHSPLPPSFPRLRVLCSFGTLHLTSPAKVKRLHKGGGATGQRLSAVSRLAR